MFQIVSSNSGIWKTKKRLISGIYFCMSSPKIPMIVLFWEFKAFRKFCAFARLMYYKKCSLAMQGRAVSPHGVQRRLSSAPLFFRWYCSRTIQLAPNLQDCPLYNWHCFMFLNISMFGYTIFSQKVWCPGTALNLTSKNVF